MAAEAQLLYANEVILVRHGERVDMTDPEWTGRTRLPNHYVPLTARGLAQAKHVGQALRRHKHRGRIHVYCSPFLRCLQTAQAIAEELEVDHFVVEEGLGEFLGETWFGGQPVYMPEMAARRGAPDDTCNPAAVELERAALPLLTRMRWPASHMVRPRYPETFEACLARYTSTVRRIARAHPDHPVVLVTHGFALAHIAERLVPGETRVQGADYCGVTRLQRVVRQRAAADGGAEQAPEELWATLEIAGSRQPPPAPQPRSGDDTPVEDVQG